MPLNGRFRQPVESGDRYRSRPKMAATCGAGTFSGNDPSVLVEARLCTDRHGRVTGVVQWSSLVSGFNEREVVGIRDATGDFELHDLSFRQYYPKFLWKFCLIDRYTLNSDRSDHLVGSYESQACSDNAQIDLSRVSAAMVPQE